MPEVMGLGTETVSGVLNSSYTLVFLVIILLGKILATSISLNFGFFGGVFLRGVKSERERLKLKA